MKKVPRYAARHMVSAHRGSLDLDELVVIPEAARQRAPQPTFRERLVEAVAAREDRRGGPSGELLGSASLEALEAANEELARAKRVLEFYATEANYRFLGAGRDVAGIPRIFRDEGRRARSFLRQEGDADAASPRPTRDSGVDSP